MKRAFPVILLAAVTALLIAGVVGLFQMRFERGDVYPPYSSLRADPLGTMALYESFGKLPGVSVRRDVSSLNRLPREAGTVYFHVAAIPYDWEQVPGDLYFEIQNFLARGGRLVIAFYPETDGYEKGMGTGTRTNGTSAGANKGKPLVPKKTAKKKDDDDSYVDLEERWGLRFAFRKLPNDGETYSPIRVLKKTDLPLPKSLDWHSGMVFADSGPAWHPIYVRDTNAVVLERSFGNGSVVLVSDSYFFSNEAMEKDRHADMLAWLVGTNMNVVFDEAHLGIVETAGVASLIRKYRLHGFVAGLLVLAGLFIWKNSSSLVPPRLGHRDSGGVVAGKDSAAGFVNLLRRNIAPADLPGTCFAEWKKSVLPGKKVSSVRFLRAEAVFNEAGPANRNPVETYRKISEELQTHTHQL